MDYLYFLFEPYFSVGYQITLHVLILTKVIHLCNSEDEDFNRQFCWKAHIILSEDVIHESQKEKYRKGYLPPTQNTLLSCNSNPSPRSIGGWIFLSSTDLQWLTRQRLKAEQALSPEGERLSDLTMEQWGDILASKPILRRVCLNSLLQGSQSAVYTF